MATGVKGFTVPVSGALKGYVTAERPAWARRVAASTDGIVMGLDRTVSLRRDGDAVIVRLEGRDGSVVPIIRVSNDGFKPLAKLKYKRKDCGITFSIDGENGLELTFDYLSMKDGHLIGEFKLKPTDAPHFYGKFELQLSGWSPPEKLKKWRCV